MELGILTVVLNDRPLEEVAKFASGLGYRAVELAAWRGSNHLDIDRVLTDPAYVRGIHETLDRYGLTISAIANHQESQFVLGPLDRATDEYAPSPEPEEKVRYGVERTIATARAAGVLGVPVVTGFTGSDVWQHWYAWPPENQAIYERAWETLAERWNPILDVFATEGVVFGHEITVPEMAYNLETAERCVQALDGRREFGFNFDPSHFVWQGIDPVVAIKQLGDRIYHVHAKDTEVQKDEVSRSGVLPGGPWQRPDRGVRFRVPGWGQIDWHRLITALLEVGYNGVLSFEHEDPVIDREDGCIQCARELGPLMLSGPIKEFGIWWGQEGNQ